MTKKIINHDHKLCDYGCGQEAKYEFGNGKLCCSKSYQGCSFIKKSRSGNEKKERKNHSEPLLEENENILCDYGCEKIAKFYNKNSKKFCCSDHYLKCKEMHKKTTDSWLDVKEIETDELCIYGCGQKAKYKSKNGELRCSKNHASCPSIRKRNSESNKIKQAGEKNARFGCKVSDETKNKIRVKIIGLWKTDTYRIKTTESLRKLWLDESFLTKWKKAKDQKPNKSELFLIPILEEYSFKYVGDYSGWIGGKNPDFINYDKNKIIEFFGYYWHSEEFRKDGKTNEEHEKERKEIFKKFGFDCLVLWEADIKDISKIKEIVENFLKFKERNINEEY